jgi:Toprim domain
MTCDRTPAAALARRLAREAEAVCRHYLPKGRREGRYWLVGDAAGNPGRSLFVRLCGEERGRGAAGKWTDAATGEHGDLLDLIAARCGLAAFRDIADEARRFLALPRPDFPSGDGRSSRGRPDAADRIAAAQRLFAMAGPIRGTIAEAYLRTRGIAAAGDAGALRFHPACYYRGDDGVRHAFPALIAAVTDDSGRIMGVHRTWLAPDGAGKAQLATPRRAMGVLLGHGVRFGFDEGHPGAIAAGEGIETMLSLRMAAPNMPLIAGLSAAHLGALFLPDGLRRLYIAADSDGAGRAGTRRLGGRAREAGIETLTLRAVLGDFNDDLRRVGPDALRLHVLRQLAPGDAVRFMS